MPLNQPPYNGSHLQCTISRTTLTQNPGPATECHAILNHVQTQTVCPESVSMMPVNYTVWWEEGGGYTCMGYILKENRETKNSLYSGVGYFGNKSFP